MYFASRRNSTSLSESPAAKYLALAVGAALERVRVVSPKTTLLTKQRLPWMVGISCVLAVGDVAAALERVRQLAGASVIERMPMTWSNGMPTIDGAIAPITSCGDAVMIHTS